MSQVHLFTNGGHAHILLSDVATQAAARAESVAAAAAGAVQHPVVSPMPGKLVHVFVSPGQQVVSHAPLLTSSWGRPRLHTLSECPGFCVLSTMRTGPQAVIL